MRKKGVTRGTQLLVVQTVVPTPPPVFLLTLLRLLWVPSSISGLPKATGSSGKQHERPLPLSTRREQLRATEIVPFSTTPRTPYRYTEASFIKELEAKGVGRPSTYASIIGTLRTRTYVNMQGRTLTPSLTGFVVADLLREHFPDFTDTGFTAKVRACKTCVFSPLYTYFWLAFQLYSLLFAFRVLLDACRSFMYPGVFVFLRSCIATSSNVLFHGRPGTAVWLFSTNGERSATTGPPFPRSRFQYLAARQSAILFRSRTGTLEHPGRLVMCS